MKLELPKLPYDVDALAPHISEQTVTFHYFKHHQGYVDKTRKAIAGTALDGLAVEDIIAETRNDPAAKKIFNSAAQIWNHALYWESMTPHGGGAPAGALADRIDRDFGSLDDFREQFKQCGLGEFGSGYAWLILSDGRLVIESATDAEIPVQNLDRALLNMDVWEHAYYLDYQHERGKYVDAFLGELINWDNVARRYQAVS